jgi:hypothetical protein
MAGGGNQVPWRTVGIVAAGGIIAGALLPWAKVASIFGTFTKDGTDGDGVFTLLGGIIIAVMFLAANRKAYTTAAVVAALVSALGLYDWADVQRLAGEAENDGSVAVSAGAGLYMTVAGGITAFVAALASRKQATPMPLPPPPVPS